MVAHGFSACLLHQSVGGGMDFSKIEETRDGGQAPEEQMVFHYDRQERLRHAPQIVRDYYSGDFKPYKGGLFKSLVATKANRLLFVTVIFTFGIILFIRYFGPEKRSGSLNKVDVSLSAFSYEDSVYVSVKYHSASKKVRENFTQEVPVYASVSAIDRDGATVGEEKVVGKYEGEELFLRTSFSDYDIIKVNAVCSMGESLLSLEAPVEKR